MRKSDKKPLLEKLAALSEQERRSLYQQAARMRKAAVLEKRKKSNKRSKYFFQLSDKQVHDREIPAGGFAKNKSRLPLGLEEWVLKLLVEKDFDVREATTDAQKETQKGMVISVASGHCKVAAVGDNLCNVKINKAKGGAGKTFSELGNDASSNGIVREESQGGSSSAANGGIYKCLIRPEWAMTQKSDLAVGDYVEFSQATDGSYVVELVLPRRSLLARPDPHDQRIKRVIAANIDIVVVVSSVKMPVLNTNLIDRYLLAIDYNDIEPLICVNKIDLLESNEDMQELEQAMKPYRQLGIGIVECSAVSRCGVERLQDILTGKTAVLVGHSGVGKSSLLNAMLPELHIPVREVHKASRRGRHTTVRSHLYYLQGDIRIIDTPGVRSFGLDNIAPEQLSWYFREFDDFAGSCKYSNCTHTHEPNCAVKEAVEQGVISAQRYMSYRRIFESLKAE